MTVLEPGSFLAELSARDRADLEELGRTREYARAEVLFPEGELSSWVAVLLSGQIKAYTNLENGGEALLAVRGPGSLLGEVAAIDRLPRSATVVTLEPARALTLTAAEFMDFLQTHGAASVLMMRMLCQRWRDADRKRAEFGRYDATGRVAERLVELAERFGTPYAPGANGAGSVQITLQLSQQELAGWVGASREAVSKALRTLRAHDLIETGRRKIIVHDLAALRRHAR
ncbi:Crp/Fnr family transcriptional regulator [Actinomadura parmotrematis]|uniref:Crp/Fnr family transcriptional regulator n=1 Tax=Actinomadura parmotrematis TaxID=2864039 RepID=A0ABS7FM83_9ACTN|nr:Crp/Fnr family transcriptional regulator [Actinomadura parmotrematis]MBW8481476.1 Crp/Fnr family transcriptional regulator [Actinomadura parmotrematis]